jgi:hypothetical protein
MKHKWIAVGFLIAGLLGAADGLRRVQEKEFRIVIRIDGFTSFELPVR